MTFLAVMLSTIANAKLAITSTTCNFQSEMALVDGALQMGWKMVADVNGERQTAYQIQIYAGNTQINADNTQRKAYNSGKVYDSGKVMTDESQLVKVPDMKYNATGYSFRVKVWNQDGRSSAWSKSQSFRVMPSSIDASWIGAISRKDARIPTGKFPNTDFKKPDFVAKWNAVDTLSAKSIILGNTFITASRKVVSAVVYVCGLGHYEMRLNGVKVGDSEFAPLWTDYDKTVYYNVYDVTSLVRKGNNAVTVLLGNGFYNVQKLGRYSKLMTSFGTPSLLLRMEMTYSDGTTQVVRSGEGWHYALSPITYNCIYGGESYDARMEQLGGGSAPMDKCANALFDGGAWHPAVYVEAPKGKLMVQTAPPVKIMERYGVKSVNHIPAERLDEASKATKRTIDKSVFVLDMGQNLAGFPEITVSGKRGQKITLLVSEKLNAQGVCDQRATGRPYYYEYTLKGDGEESWHPRFTYYGFRYIQVEGAVLESTASGNAVLGDAVNDNASQLPVIKDIRSCFVYDSAPEVSAFACSNPLFTRTHRLIERAERSNMQSVFTDCPHREKLGWLEQDHLCGPSLLYNYDLTTYVPKVMRDIADAQKLDGMIPTTAPQYVSFGNLFDDSPEWGSTSIILPFMYYDQYGDRSLIQKCYPMMCRYVDYLSSRAQGHILDFGLGDWFDYGPWVAGFARNTSVALVATSHYIYDLQLLKRASDMMDDPVSHARYTALLDSVTTAFNACFYKADSCYYDTGSQTANSLPLFLGVTGENKEKVMASLVADIRAHGNRLTTGDVGNRYLFQTLARQGQNELLYQMLNHDEAPGYGFQLKFDATTLTEQWDPRKGSSWNHFMMGQIDEWLFCTLGGIQNQPGTYGLRHMLIAPTLVGDMTWVKASTRSLYGDISVELTKRNLVVSVPVGSDAVIVLPDGTRKEVGSGKYTYKY